MPFSWLFRSGILWILVLVSIYGVQRRTQPVGAGNLRTTLEPDGSIIRNAAWKWTKKSLSGNFFERKYSRIVLLGMTARKLYLVDFFSSNSSLGTLGKIIIKSVLNFASFLLLPIAHRSHICTQLHRMQQGNCDGVNTDISSEANARWV